MSRADLDKDPHAVAAMFDGVARRYDLTNTVLTAGQDRRWRALARRALDLRPGEIVLDLAAGTAVSTVELARSGAWCVAADFSLGMLRAGAARPVPKVAADALALPFADAVFDAVTIAFGLRNVHDPDRALAELARVTKPGGRLVVCEFGRPTWAPFRAAYYLGLERVLPAVADARLQQPRGLPLPRRVDPGLARPARAGRPHRGRGLDRGGVAQPRGRRGRAPPRPSTVTGHRLAGGAPDA